MKRLTILAVCLFSFALIHAQAKQVKSSNMNEPYKVNFKNVSIGNSALAQKVLWLWKYYDDNTLDKAADWIDDNVEATFPDGSLIKGKDKFIKAAMDSRNSIASITEEVDACVALKSPDAPNNTVVTIWGTETDTAKDGTVTKTHLNEVWFFNKEGKVVQFHQMAAKDAPQQK